MLRGEREVSTVGSGLSLGEEFLDGFVGDHLLLEGVSARLGGLDHLDDLGVGATVCLLK